jgi:hypothetical protein
MISFKKEFLTEYHKKILEVDGREYIELYRRIENTNMFEIIGKSINQQIKADEKLNEYAVLVNEIICEDDEYRIMNLVKELNEALREDEAK